MHEVLPLELNHTFHCQILSSQLIFNSPHRAFYSCATNFGAMTLVVEHQHSDGLQSESISTGQNHSHNQSDLNEAAIEDPKQIFLRRNRFLTQYPFSTLIPVIYEQHVISTHKCKSTCLTLLEPISIIPINDFKDVIQLQKQKNLILSLFIIENNSLSLKIDHKSPQTVFLKSQFSHSLHIDFTQLRIYQHQKLQAFHSKKQIGQLLANLYSQQKEAASQVLKEIILIKDQIYRFSTAKLLNRPFESYFQLAVCLNFCSDHELFLKAKPSTETKDKNHNFKKLNIKPVISNSNKLPIEPSHSQSTAISSEFHFYDSYCTDLLQPIKYEQLVDRFFIDNSCYKLNKSVYLQVQRLFTNQTHQKSDTIHIEQNVSKSQCINFLITYSNFITPNIQKINFLPYENTLVFQFLGKLKVPRKLHLVFHPNYIVKDQELSMIIEKCKLQKVVVKLSQMQITDSFLMFLANSQKMSKVIELDISHCHKVTENGVNSLLISPHCKKLETLNVSGTPVTPSSVQSLILKTKLKSLSMNHCSEDYPDETFALKNVNLIKLEALGMNVSPSFSSKLEVLAIDVQLPFDFLKELKDMPLKLLKVNLVEEKKNFIGGFLGTIGNFYTKEANSIKLFAQGRPSQTLRSLDLSGSNAKLKNLRPLFSMPQLQVLSLEDITTPQEIDFIISPRILQLSIRNSSITSRELLKLLKNTKIVMKINVALSEVKKQEIKEFISHTKKYINTLIISENQYCPNLIDPNGKVSEYVQTFEIVCKESFFRQKNQNIISAMIFKTLKGNKTLKIQPLVNSASYKDQNKLNFERKQFQFFVMKQLRKIIPLQKKESVNNIFINDKPYQSLIASQKRQYEKFEIGSEQFLRVQNANSRKQKIYKLVQEIQKFVQEPGNIRQTFDPQNASITYFTYMYKKAVIENPKELFEVSLGNNKLIDCETAFKIMTSYSCDKQIKTVDMRGAALFSPRIFFEVTELPHLQSFNHNQYQIVFDGENFVDLSQKYLKFFMRIQSVRKLKLLCKNILEVDILFSIMFHILDSHYETIQALDCTFENVKMKTQNSLSFWTKIPQLKKLTFLKLNFINCPTAFLKRIFDEHQWNTHKKLETIILSGLDYHSLPIVQNDSSVKSIALNLERFLFADNSQKINESHLIKFLKTFGSSLKKLKLNLNQCENITHPNRLFAAIQNFDSLEKLCLSFQYCPIKELSTLDLMQNIYSLKKLRQVQLDLSYTSVPFASLSSIIKNFPIKLPNCHFAIYLLGNQTKQIIFDKEGLLNQGVQVVL